MEPRGSLFSGGAVSRSARELSARLARSLLEHTGDLLFAVDAERRLLAVNPAFERLTGLSSAALLGREALVLLPFEAAMLAARLAAAAEGATPGPFEVAWHDRDGTPRVHEFTLLADRQAPGQVMVHAREVTAQRRVEDDLRAREAEFRTLAENSPDNIIRYGLDGRATYCNREIEGRVAVEARRIVGRTPGEAAPPGMEGVESYERQLQRTLTTGERGRVELLVPHPEGGTRVHSVAFAPEFDAAGEVRGAVAVGRDVTEEVRIREALAAKEREFRTLAENSPDVILRYDLGMTVVYCNPTITEKSGVPVAAVLGRRALASVPPGMVGADGYLRQLRDTLLTGHRGSVEIRSLDPRGQWRAYSIEFIAERGADGKVCGALAVGREVTQQAAATQALADKEREFRSLAENAGDNIVRWDLQARMRYVNPAMARVFAVQPADLLGLTPLDLSSDDRFAVVNEAVLQAIREGRPRTLELRFPRIQGPGTQVHEIRLVPERDERGAVCSVLGIGRDVTEKIEQLELIESLVRTDPLTRLANRQALVERAPALFSNASRRGEQVGVMVLDLDGFKSVNDGLGHSAGDTLLRLIAGRLQDCLRANDLLVRLGGDEFVVVAPDIRDAEVLGAVSDKLHRALAEPTDLAGREIHVTASIGVALFPCDGDGLDLLLAHADSAMYHAKRGGRGRTEFYRRELSEAVQRRLLLENSLREASQGCGLELHFQPQAHLGASGRPVGAEALLRWHHPGLGLLMPDSFIALAEETGAIVPIGRWVLRTAAEAAVNWNRGRSQPIGVSVNVSTRQVVRDDLAQVVREVLASTGCEPGWLTVEITESALLEDSALVQQVLGALRDIGVRIALDDFGTGYSSLNYLARFPVDCLKIDKSFVWGIERSEREGELVKAFIAMAAALHLDLVAEGVETEGQASFLLAHGCVHGQGWLFGRPMPAGAFERLLRD